jgi:hypothetical protein
VAVVASGCTLSVCEEEERRDLGRLKGRVGRKEGRK